MNPPRSSSLLSGGGPVSEHNRWGLSRLQMGSVSLEGRSPVDIVLVHGFRGDRHKTWRAPLGPSWLQDFLPFDMREANIYTFGHPDFTPTNSVAIDLVQSLDDERSDRDNFDVPIVFIAHTTGGFIVKQALVLLASYQAKSRTRILTNTRSLLFFGVPHRGMEQTNTLKTMVNILHHLSDTPKVAGARKGFLPSKEELRQMLEAFASISGRFQIYSFCPVKATNSVDRVLISDPMTFIMGLPNEELFFIPTPLGKMVKFLSDGDPTYRKTLSILKRTSAGGGFLATENWRREQMFRLDGEESESAKQWFTDLRHDAHRVIDNRPIARRSKIAILDTGIDWNHPSFRESVVAGRIIAKSFVEGLRGDHDSNGHGTHAAHVALKMAPNSRLFIARVIEDGTPTEFEKNCTAIVEAIKWAVAQGVDIISMSFGYRVANDEIKAAIRYAFHQGVILVAAASNSGVNPRFPISFPANMRQVICVHSSDGSGNPSPRNPPARPDCDLAVLGEGVAAAWPRELYTERQDRLRVASGTSVAAPVAAGLAALIIEYAAQEGPEDEVVTRWMQLRHCDEMRKTFGVMARERSGYRSIAPSCLFEYHGDNMHQRIAGRINDVLDSL